ncbi:tryptophan synthase subunit beta [Actinomyces gaoshouyii]|uniref:Tryptophan synthase beta chain n=1 Tax=Actinomyces gaoshouyii TaxID=1960083 RepID=A0A8H9H9N0_9ACTO|nr:tryptophan synthase subunit beta [Actinomyces gaoshouyii]GGO97293.1 tryptophan synthase beta chain [Actinomyces gaoshouyii]
MSTANAAQSAPTAHDAESLPGAAPTAGRVPTGPLGPDAPGYTAPAPGTDIPRRTLLPAFFGRFGGQEVPDFLLPALDELEAAYTEAVDDPDFLAALEDLREGYLGRPTPLYECRGLSRPDTRIILKREDLVHGGAHKGNNALGQALLAKRMGKTRLIAETGAGQHGTATAMVAALLGLECTIYMGAHDVERQRPNVERMELMGARVVPVTTGSQGLKDAVDTALTQWCERLESTAYILGSATGPHPFPTIVRYFQSVISIESRAQMLARYGRLPDAVIACVGGGSNAIGAFSDYLDDDVELIGVEPAGRGLSTGLHGAPICAGRTGVLHGTRSYVMLDDDGAVLPSHSISAGLDYPSVGPEHAHLADTGRARYVGITDDDALAAFRELSRGEGIIPAMESSHALAEALRIAREREVGGQTEDMLLLVNLSGRGDKDMHEVREHLS